MTLTQCLREPLTDTGCVCCQGLAGAVAFVLGKCLLTYGGSAKRVFVLRFSVAAVPFTVRDLSV